MADSEYNQEMTICKNFVRAHQLPKDIEAQQIVYNYYIYALQSYWRKCKDYLQDGIYQDLDRYDRRKLLGIMGRYDRRRDTLDIDLRTIRARWDEYNKFVQLQLSQLESQFKHTNQVNVSAILFLFEYIARLFCLQPVEIRLTLDLIRQAENQVGASFNIGRSHENKPILEVLIRTLYPGQSYLELYENITVQLQVLISMDRNSIYDSFFPLPNETGLFGLNSYLYCYFNGIYLIGVPSTIAQFDLLSGCPGEFMYHDFGHSHRIMDMDLNYIDPVRTMYYDIIKDETISSLNKDLLILNLWLEIHEGYTINYDQPDKIFKSLVRMIAVPVEFESEYHRYDDLIMTPKNIRRVVESIESHIQTNESNIYTLNGLLSFSCKEYVPSSCVSKLSPEEWLDAIASGAQTDHSVVNMIALHLLVNWTAYLQIRRRLSNLDLVKQIIDK